MDLREKIAEELWREVFALDEAPPEPFAASTPALSDAFRAQYLRYADRILAIPEIADALKLVPVKNLGPSVSTGKRDPV